MTKKDYEAIAKTIAQFAKKEIAMGAKPAIKERMMIVRLIDDFAPMLKQDNSNFDADKFRTKIFKLTGEDT